MGRAVRSRGRGAVASGLMAETAGRSNGISKVLLGLVSLVLVVGGLELALRGYHWVKEQRARANQPPVSARALVPSDDPELIFAWNPGFRKDAFTVNSHGMADAEISRKKSPGVFRIAIVGDSVSANFGLVDREDIFPTLIEERLAGSTGPRVETLNFGVNAYSLLQSLRTARTRVLSFDPDLLVVQLCLNDPIPSGTPYLPRPPAYASRLWAFLQLRLDPNRFWGRFHVDGHYDAAGWANVRRAIAGFGELAREGPPTLLVLFPYLQTAAYEQWGYGDLHAGYREAAEAAGLPFLDLHPDFAAAGLLADGWPGPVLHPGPAGHSLAADRILDVLAERDLLPEPAP